MSDPDCTDANDHKLLPVASACSADTPTYQFYPMMEGIRASIRPYVQPGEMLIYRDAFRWKTDDGHVMSNHYEMFSLAELAADFGYEVIHDFNHVAVVRKK